MYKSWKSCKETLRPFPGSVPLPRRGVLHLGAHGVQVQGHPGAAGAAVLLLLQSIR